MKFNLSLVLVAGLFSGLVQSETTADDVSMLGLQIGEPFPRAPVLDRSDEDSQDPAIQFQVPNSGETAEMFPEFMVTIARSTGRVAQVLATRQFVGLEKCKLEHGKVVELLEKYFPNIKDDPRYHPYEGEERGLLVTAHCSVRNHSPYHTLTLEIWGKQEKEELTKAWEKYLGVQFGN